MEIASDVQLDLKEMELDANNAHALIKIYFSGKLHQLKLVQLLIQVQLLILQPQLQPAPNAQNLQHGIKPQNNAFTAHYLTLLLLKLLKENGNVLVMLQENLLLNLMEQELVNDYDLFS